MALVEWIDENGEKGTGTADSDSSFYLHFLMGHTSLLYFTAEGTWSKKAGDCWGAAVLGVEPWGLL